MLLDLFLRTIPHLLYHGFLLSICGTRLDYQQNGYLIPLLYEEALVSTLELFLTGYVHRKMQSCGRRERFCHKNPLNPQGSQQMIEDIHKKELFAKCCLHDKDTPTQDILNFLTREA